MSREMRASREGDLVAADMSAETDAVSAVISHQCSTCGGADHNAMATASTGQWY